MRTLLSIALFIFSSVAVADCRLSLPRAGFADQIRDREPVGDGTAARDRLWFFNEIVDGKDQVLVHQWYRDGEEDARIRLPVGADRWRTWSGRRLEAGVRLTVRVTTESGCDLGEYGVATPASPAAADPLSAARAALATGDVTGARLLARQAQEGGNRNSALNRFIDEDLALAELARDIDGDNLYVAGGWIAALKKRPLSGHHGIALTELEARWQTRRETLQRELNTRLMALQRTLASLPPGASCANAVESNDWLPEPERDQLIITGQRHEAGIQTMELLDQRTGLSHRLERPCLNP
ncbi:MAG: DUF2914 domain-containing protein [Alcanivoracaceae bacterium]